MYNVYDKPWRAGANLADKIYRPGKSADKDVYGDDVEKLIKSSRLANKQSIIMVVLTKNVSLIEYERI